MPFTLLSLYPFMSQRIHSIDAVRALALFGILLTHASFRFNYLPAPGMDTVSHVYAWLAQHIFACKFFMVFAFLFGLSFFLQMDHAVERGIDFRGRFCWRLVLLFFFGVFHSFFYMGDILTIFAILGFIPVVLWQVPTRTLAILCILCLLQPVVLCTELAGTSHFLQETGDKVVAWFAPQERYLAMQDSVWQNGVWNICSGHIHSLVYTFISSGRIFILIGMFMLGMLAGRTRIFEKNPQRLLYIGSAGVVVYGIGLLGQQFLPLWMYWWEQIGFVLMFVPWAAWLLARPALSTLISPLTAIGRTTLTCYITQNIIMGFLLCAYGFNMNVCWTTTQVMNAAIILYIAQVLFSMAWLKYHRYGPFEAVWRRLTRLGMKP